MRRTTSSARAPAAPSRSRPERPSATSTTRSLRRAATRRSRWSRSRPAWTRRRRERASTRQVEMSGRRSMSWVERELREQPAALARFLDRERDDVRARAPALLERDVRYLLIASRGSSGNAARYAQYLFGALNRLPVAFSTPSLYTLYDAPPELDGARAVAISQSGESPDVASVLAEAKRQGRPTVAITNEAASPLARHADWVLPLHAGHERAVAATKTYLNSVAAVALLSAALARDDTRIAAIADMPDAVEAQVERSL